VAGGFFGLLQGRQDPLFRNPCDAAGRSVQAASALEKVKTTPGLTVIDPLLLRLVSGWYMLQA